MPIPSSTRSTTGSRACRREAAHHALVTLDGTVKPDALSLAALAFEAPEDTHTIVFTV